ncbi:GNAT domain-containing protein [Phlebopus sp. FC_14]|nr:GNAT domain-containing protein [Phlebopus sp. FC_14]
MITDAILRGQKVVLVPYKPEHVEKYHQWMSDPTLQQLTASEPLTLDEEYEMQKRWREDPDKLTFIILASEGEGDVPALPMAGDVNLFLKGSPDDEDFEAEAEIMIAEQAYRRKGFALEALRLMFAYATSSSADFACPPLPSSILPPPNPLPISPERLVVRISEENQPSISLFQQLGFVVVRVVQVFHEVEMRFRRPQKS